VRGEYEANPERIGTIVRPFFYCLPQLGLTALQVNANMERPLRLASIRFTPLPSHTRPGFLSALMTPFLSPPSPHLPAFLNPAPLQDSPKSLHEILITTKGIVEHLRRFDTFHEDIKVELRPKRGAEEGDLELCLGLREKGRVMIKAGTEVGAGEAGGVSIPSTL
jgi:outer membrane protein insertion porin family